MCPELFKAVYYTLFLWLPVVQGKADRLTIILAVSFGVIFLAVLAFAAIMIGKYLIDLISKPGCHETVSPCVKNSGWTFYNSTHFLIPIYLQSQIQFCKHNLQEVFDRLIETIPLLLCQVLV